MWHGRGRGAPLLGLIPLRCPHPHLHGHNHSHSHPRPYPSPSFPIPHCHPIAVPTPSAPHPTPSPLHLHSPFLHPNCSFSPPLPTQILFIWEVGAINPPPPFSPLQNPHPALHPPTLPYSHFFHPQTVDPIWTLLSAPRTPHPPSIPPPPPMKRTQPPPICPLKPQTEPKPPHRAPRDRDRDREGGGLFSQHFSGFPDIVLSSSTGSHPGNLPFTVPLWGGFINLGLISVLPSHLFKGFPQTLRGGIPILPNRDPTAPHRRGKSPKLSVFNPN